MGDATRRWLRGVAEVSLRTEACSFPELSSERDTAGVGKVSLSSFKRALWHTCETSSSAGPSTGAARGGIPASPRGNAGAVDVFVLNTWDCPGAFLF